MLAVDLELIKDLAFRDQVYCDGRVVEATSARGVDLLELAE